MNYKFLLAIGFCFLLIAASCSNGVNIENIADKQTYITQIEKLSDADRKQQLERDIDCLEKALVICQDWSTYYGFASSTSGDPSIGIKNENDAENPFMIFPAEDYKNDFEQINKNNIIATQKITESDSNFDFYIKKVSFDPIKEFDLKYTVKEVFEKGNRNNTQTNRLLPTDSLAVEVSYIYPTDFDSITINKGANSVVYNKDTINIEYYTSGQEVNLNMPINLNVIGYRATDSRGILMSEDSYANYPITNFSPSVIAQVKDGLALLIKALKTSNKEQSIAYIKEIPNDSFNKMALFVNFNRDLEEMAKKEESSNDKGFKELFNSINGLEWLIKKYDSVLVKSTKIINISFPRPISKIYLYIATQQEKCDTTLVIKTAKDNIFAYNVFTDSTETKFGISDDKGQVIIPATYSKISRSDTLYFRITENDKEFSAYLNPETKKLEILPENLKIVKQLRSDMLIFANADGSKGVLKNLKEEIIPFKYDKISVVGKTIVAEASKRGREYYEFYSLDGKRLDIPPVDNVDYHENFNSGIIIVSKDNKYGFVNKDGVISISPKYQKLDFISNNLLSYQTDRKIQYGYTGDSKYLVGVIDIKGNEISEPIYIETNTLSDDRALVKVYIDEGDYQKFIFAGYIDEKGKIAIEPQYSEAYDFYEGYALVSNKDNYELIDKNGNIVKEFEKESNIYPVEKDMDNNHADFHYKSDKGEIFNYKGDKIK